MTNSWKPIEGQHNEIIRFLHIKNLPFIFGLIYILLSFLFLILFFQGCVKSKKQEKSSFINVLHLTKIILLSFLF